MTAGQLAVLRALKDGPLSASEVHGEGSVAAVRKRFRRLEDRGFVRRTYPEGSDSIRWELTAGGRGLV